MNESGSNDQGGAGGESTWRWRHGPRKLFTIAMSLTYWMIGGLLFVLVGLICAPLLPRTKSRALGQWLLQRAFRLYLLLLRLLNVLKVEHHGLEKLQHATGGLILAPNHPAMWDVVCIISRIHGLRCILKASLMQNPMLIGGATLAGFIPNKPVHRMLQRSIDALRQGDRLLVFPEGTRTRKKEGLVNPFQGGIGIMAAQSGAPVWPLFIETDSDFLCKGCPPWRMQDACVHVRISVGEPLACDADETAQQFVKRLEETFIEALGKK